MRKKGNIIASICIIAVVFAMTIAGFVVEFYDNRTKFSGNVYINGNDVRGYTIEKATQIVGEKIKSELDGIDIKIIYKDKVWKFTESDFEVDNAVKNVVNTAFKNNKIGNREAVDFVANKTGNFQMAINDVFKNFDEKINDIANEIDTKPINASVSFEPNAKEMFTINEAKKGIEVDKDRLICDLKNQFLKEKEITIYVHTKAIEPEITSEYFDDKLNLQSTFSTSIKGSQEGRRNNVIVALKKINGTVVKSGEIVSFNTLTSPQNASGGYQNAIIIMNGKYENGIGGGLCQASTTLYNACVLANLEIEEVHKHTIPVHYVEHALDAMISDGYADMIFRNTSNDDIYIKSFVDGDDATVEIYGKSIPDGVTIKRVAEEIKEIPHQGDKVVADTDGSYKDKVLYKGEYYRLKYPASGYEAKAYKEYYKNGKLIKREEIRHETYQPQQGVVIEGTEELPDGFVLPKQDVTIYPPESMQRA